MRIAQQLPKESIHYFADTLHVPYGPRPDSDIRAFAGGIVRNFVRQDAKAVVAACNLSSAVALEDLAQEVDIPLIGMIRPGARAALEASSGGPIGVLATEGTVRSGAYARAIQALEPGRPVIQVSCPNFVPLVEAGRYDSDEALTAARMYVFPLIQSRVRTVILGCTHYPFLDKILRAALPSTTVLVDPAEAVTAQLARVLEERDLQWHGSPAPHQFEASADPGRLEAAVKRWMGLKVRAENSRLWSAPAEDHGLAAARG
jgi:glutamate racemase